MLKFRPFKRICRDTRKPLMSEEIRRIPFVEAKPLQLQNSIEKKYNKEANTSCLEEMAVMFACMKKNEFQEVKCADEINVFNKCYKEYSANRKEKKQREISGEIVVGSNVRNMTVKQLNQMLSKYPQFNEKL